MKEELFDLGVDLLLGPFGVEVTQGSSFESHGIAAHAAGKQQLVSRRHGAIYLDLLRSHVNAECRMPNCGW